MKFYEYLAKISTSEWSYWENTWKFWEKYDTLKENIDKMGDWLDDYINKDLYEKNIDRIVDEIIKIGYTGRRNQGWVCNGETYTMEIEEYFEPERMREELKKYHVYGYYNRLFDVFHGNYSNFKHAIEHIDKMNFGKWKGKNNTRQILQDAFSYYRDVVSHRKWQELIFRKKREWKRSKKQTFAFEYQAKGTNWTSDWYDDKKEDGLVIITAMNEKHALEVLLGHDEKDNSYGWALKGMVDVHRLDRVSIQRVKLSKEISDKFKEQKNHWRYRPWHVYLNSQSNA